MNSQMLQPIEILMIEDSPSDANLTIKGFQNGKITNKLNWVEDGETAMEYLRQEGEYADATRPDLILLDLNLPGMDGREVLIEIKADPNLQLIPVVVLTTSADEEDVLRSYQLNANCYCTKPIDVHRFIELVQLINDFWLAAVKLPKE
ncbi:MULTISPECIES: response regulator [unclassified Coleofasciculus]|uniref:response regulator n=1 Tax=unclassified Coleofasciculus TaxID=2692782 RepID=UPI001880807A|nr:MULTISPECIES: response regulator [unclassified Coleofasciculus]MBE9126818.1 response regulator [Coleofasciculus sp. LEGE 07081]MBE9150189.1 response regulator [Coleofasciculus sp. LEGE 07092]